MVWSELKLHSTNGLPVLKFGSTNGVHDLVNLAKVQPVAPVSGMSVVDAVDATDQPAVSYAVPHGFAELVQVAGEVARVDDEVGAQLAAFVGPLPVVNVVPLGLGVVGGHTGDNSVGPALVVVSLAEVVGGRCPLAVAERHLFQAVAVEVPDPVVELVVY